MKTVHTKIVVNTQAIKVWEDLDLPIAVTDQFGQLYLINTTEVDLDQDGVEDAELYYLTDIMRGHTHNVGYYTVRDLIAAFAGDGKDGLELKPATIEVAVIDYPEVK